MNKVIVLGSEGYALPFMGTWNVTVVPYVPNGLNIREYDLVCFTGGEDVHPDAYGEAMNRHTYTDESRDLLEFGVFDQAKQYGIPMVGICRGAQMLCVKNDGRLVQHTTNHTNTSHPAEVRIGGASVMVNVIGDHHQMMWPSDNAKILAISDPLSDTYQDGKGKELPSYVLQHGGDIEAAYWPDTKSLGVQWHPEWHREGDAGLNVFNQLIEEYLL